MSVTSLRKDVHICGDCETHFEDIEDFIFHKIQIEKLKLRLIPSTKVKDLLIPAFIYDDNSKTIVLTQENPSKTGNSENKQSGECRKILTQDFILQVHKKHCHENDNFCEVNFESIKSKNYFRHDYGCNFKNCSYAFKTKGSLKRHERRHTGERPYICELCGRNFTESGALKRHKRSRILCTNKSDSDLPRYGKRMEDNKLGNIIDGTDNAVLDDLDVVDVEMNDSVNEEKFQVCDICDASFDEVKELRNHLLIHAGKQYVKCGICKFVSYEKEAVIDHMEKFHSEFNNESPHEVEVKLIIHDSTTVDENERLGNVRNDFKCAICPQMFETDIDLKAHSLKHTVVKTSFSCLICNKEFLTKSNLRKHSLSHSEQRNFRCSECGKLFKRISHAREHIKTTHSNQKPFECVLCKKLFKTMSSMKTHTKIHKSDLPFGCHLCDKSFREKASLQRHIRSHTGEKPFVCRYCGHSFAEHGTLNRHLKAKLPCYFQSINQLPAEQLLIHTFEHTNHQESLVDVTLSCETFVDPQIKLDDRSPMLS